MLLNSTIINIESSDLNGIKLMSVVKFSQNMVVLFNLLAQFFIHTSDAGSEPLHGSKYMF